MGFPENKRIEYEQEMYDERRRRGEIKAARLDGFDEGHKEGRAEGLAEGEAKGRAEGLAEGLAEGKAAVAASMIKEGLDLQLISKLTGFSIEELKNL